MTPPTGSPGGQPGWTPGGPPPAPPGRYPGRTPPRLSGFPLYCLGCVGVVFLVFVALAGYGLLQARKMMGPPITQATLQSALPPGVPVYPRFTLLEKGSRHIKVPIPGSAGGATPQMTMLTFTCPDPLSTVGPWYQQALAPRGWTGGLSPQNPNQYLLKQGNTTLVLQETSQRRQQVITMMIARDPSRPGTPPMPVTPSVPGP